jgi:hypothetical protein
MSRIVGLDELCRAPSLTTPSAAACGKDQHDNDNNRAQQGHFSILYHGNTSKLSNMLGTPKKKRGSSPALDQ